MSKKRVPTKKTTGKKKSKVVVEDPEILEIKDNSTPKKSKTAKPSKNEVVNKLDPSEIENKPSEAKEKIKSGLEFTGNYLVILWASLLVYLSNFRELLKTKEGQRGLLGFIFTLLVGLMPFLWQSIDPSTFPSANIGTLYMITFLFISPFLANSIGAVRLSNKDEDIVGTLLKSGNLSVGITFGLIILTLIVSEFLPSSTIVWTFLLLILMIYAGGYLLYSSGMLSNEGTVNLVKVITKFILLLSLTEFLVTVYILPYSINREAVGFLGFAFVLFNSLIIIGLIAPLIQDVYNFISHKYLNYREKETGERLIKYPLKSNYIEILESNDITFVSQLENMSVDKLSKIDGITKFDAVIILTSVFDLDEEELLDENIEE